MERVCFLLSLDPELVEEYTARHAEVWPDMLRELERAGRRNYSLFLSGDATLVGYYETDDDDAARSYLASSEVARRWEAEMNRFFLGLHGRADQVSLGLEEVFHLETQLAAYAARESEQ